MLTSFLQIIKWKNLLHIVVVQFLLKFCFLNGYDFQTKLTFVDLTILSIATTSILVSGHLFNYYLAPKKREDIFSKTHALYISYVFGFVGTIVGIYLSFFIDKPSYSFIFILSLLAVLSYFKLIRIKTFFSNIAVSFVRVFSVLLVLWFDYPVNLEVNQFNLFFNLELIIISFIGYSFFANIIRGILFDIKNINNDHFENQQTLPILLGRKRAKNIVNVILIGLMLIATVILFLIKIKFIQFIILFTVVFPQLWFIYQLSVASSDKQYKLLYNKGNLAYYFTFLSVPLFTYYFKYVIT